MRFGVRHWLLGTTALTGAGCGGRTDLLGPSAGEMAVASAGSQLEGSGTCATLEQLDSVCPPDLAWDNHGQYVSCVTRYLDARVAAGDISEGQKSALVSEAAHSSGDKKYRSAKWAVDDCTAVDAGLVGAGGASDAFGAEDIGGAGGTSDLGRAGGYESGQGGRL